MAGAGESDEFDDFDDVDAWAADARARDAAESRVRERWLRTQAEEGAQFTAVLAGLAEQGGPVTVMTAAGRPRSGRIAAVGDDFVALVLPGGRRTLIALDAVDWVQPAPAPGRRRAETGLGDRDDLADDEPTPAALVDVLAQAVAHRPRVAIEAAGATLTGELRSVGLDLLALETGGDLPSASPAPGRALTYVRLRAVYEISFLDSG